ncbi:MAG: 3-deoxy-8-phosphooctulonate synthase [Verrucomicrobiota bacterium]|nr:3-deoxy-8-phosphooctulonate synthase [Verrucomicrobiota bacterium]
MKTVNLRHIQIGAGHPLVFILGPCVVEGEKMTMKIAEQLAQMSRKLHFPLIFKASYDKANRSSSQSFRGLGAKKGLEIIQKVGKEFNLPVITDIHSADEATLAAEYCDCLQIPAFLCRQTDLLLAAAKTGRLINIKKGQFLAPGDMKNVVEKMKEGGNKKLLLTERGSTFGYHNLVVDMRGLSIMRDLGFPVIMDATHAVQLPGAGGDKSTGQAQFAPLIARAAVAAGVDGLFIETHPDPSKALSDGPNMIPLKNLSSLIVQLQSIHEIVHH